MIKWLNQHPKFRTTAFWTSVVAALVMIAKQIASLLGYQIELQINQYQEIALTVIAVLASLGVFIIPPQSDQKVQEQQDQTQNP